MSACNARPEPPHPFAGTGVACHFAIGHGGPHAWDASRVVDGNAQLQRLDGVIRFVVERDLPWLAEWERERLIGHLTGAVFVEATHAATGDLYRVAREVVDEVLGAGAYARVNRGNPDPRVHEQVRESERTEAES